MIMYINTMKFLVTDMVRVGEYYSKVCEKYGAELATIFLSTVERWDGVTSRLTLFDIYYEHKTIEMLLNNAIEEFEQINNRLSML